MKPSKTLFSGNEPCSSCPYRKDAPLQFWAKEEFDNLQEKEKSTFGTVFQCHKKDGSICKGWLMMQLEKGTPSIQLRLAVIKEKPTQDFFGVGNISTGNI